MSIMKLATLVGGCSLIGYALVKKGPKMIEFVKNKTKHITAGLNNKLNEETE